MPNKLLHLNVDAILDKHFNTDYKGYSPIEVDQFLDEVINDYDAYDAMINDLNEELSNANAEIENLKNKVADLEAKLKKAEEETSPYTTVGSNLSQVDILRRIARLEQEVYNKK